MEKAILEWISGKDLDISFAEEERKEEGKETKVNNGFGRSQLLRDINRETNKITRKNTDRKYAQVTREFISWSKAQNDNFNLLNTSTENIVEYLKYYSNITIKGKPYSMEAFEQQNAGLKYFFNLLYGVSFDIEDPECAAAIRHLRKAHKKKIKYDTNYDILKDKLEIEDMKKIYDGFKTELIQCGEVFQEQAVVVRTTNTEKEKICTSSIIDKKQNEIQRHNTVMIWLDFMLSYYMLLRSQSRCFIEIDHFKLQYLNFINPVYTEKVQIVVLKKYNAKNIKDGDKPQYASMIRSSQIDECPVFALSLYLFMKFQNSFFLKQKESDSLPTPKAELHPEPKPVISNILSSLKSSPLKSSPKRTANIKTKKAQREIYENMNREWNHQVLFTTYTGNPITTAFLSSNTSKFLSKFLPDKFFSSTTHLGRKTAASIAADLGIPEFMIKSQGGWAQDDCHLKSYYRGQDLEYLYKMHGHIFQTDPMRPKAIGVINLERSILNWNSIIFTNFEQKLFPWLETEFNDRDSDNSSVTEMIALFKYARKCLIEDVIDFSISNNVSYINLFGDLFNDNAFQTLYDAVKSVNEFKAGKIKLTEISNFEVIDANVLSEITNNLGLGDGELLSIDNTNMMNRISAKQIETLQFMKMTNLNLNNNDLKLTTFVDNLREANEKSIFEIKKCLQEIEAKHSSDNVKLLKAIKHNDDVFATRLKHLEGIVEGVQHSIFQSHLNTTQRKRDHDEMETEFENSQEQSEQHLISSHISKLTSKILDGKRREHINNFEMAKLRKQNTNLKQDVQNLKEELEECQKKVESFAQKVELSTIKSIEYCYREWSGELSNKKLINNDIKEMFRKREKISNFINSVHDYITNTIIDKDINSINASRVARSLDMYVKYKLKTTASCFVDDIDRYVIDETFKKDFMNFFIK